MEFLLVLITTLAISVSSGIFPKSKDSNQSEEVKVIQTKEIKPPVAKVQLEESIKEPEPIIEEAKPEPVQIEEASEEKSSWLNIVLYILGIVAVIAAGIYFFIRRENPSSSSTVDTTRREFNEETTTAPLEQESTQEETHPEQQETQPTEVDKEKSPEDNSSDDNNK